MSGEAAALGDLAAGALMARAVEPGAGEVRHASAAEMCLNCGADLATPFCGQCGQSAHTHRSLHTFWHDFLHSIFHFDGKMWRTLPLLIAKPGQLTRRYVHGERAKFVSPLALFLFSVFAMFAVFNWIGGPVPMQPGTAAGMMDRGEIDKDLAKSRTELAALEAEKETGNGAIDGPRAGAIAALEQKIAGLEAARRIAIGEKVSTGDLSRAGVKADTGNKALDEKIQHAFDNPQLFFYKLQSNAYKFSWLLIPLSLPFVWLMFAWKRDVKIYDHLVFITYSLCFVTMLLVVASCLAHVGSLEALRGPMVGFGIPAHMFFQVRGAYRLGIVSALWRTVALGISAALVVILFSSILILLGVT